MDIKSLIDRVAALGFDLTPDLIGGTIGLYGPLALRPDEARVTRDLAYGDDPKQRLDIFHAEADGAGRPMLLFVHGGGFVMGDKGQPGDPFQNNIGAWAAQNGIVGATMTYRLAPGHQYPSGSHDVAAAVRWLRAHAADYGGDPERIFVMGTSAGAVHVAGFVVDQALRGDAGIAGALLISGIFDYTRVTPSPNHVAYYGDDVATVPGSTLLDGLVRSDLPIFYSVSEYDPADFQRQALYVVEATLAARGRWPDIHMLAGRNHLSSTFQIGSAHDTLGPLVAEFIARAG